MFLEPAAFPFRSLSLVSTNCQGERGVKDPCPCQNGPSTPFLNFRTRFPRMATHNVIDRMGAQLRQNNNHVIQAVKACAVLRIVAALQIRISAALTISVSKIHFRSYGESPAQILHGRTQAVSNSASPELVRMEPIVWTAGNQCY